MWPDASPATSEDHILVYEMFYLGFYFPFFHLRDLLKAWNVISWADITQYVAQPDANMNIALVFLIRKCHRQLNINTSFKFSFCIG